ncbi:MAG: hypothetical protein FWC34_00945, partial [Bacteroidetes bacterium]|nr:hypothetical protein [Bacteroidota bacterium]
MAAIIIIGIIILIVFAVWSKKKAAFVNPHGEKKSEGVILMQDTEQHLFPFSEYKQSLSPILQKEANHNFSQEIGNVAITPPNHSNYYNDDSIIDVTDQFRRINSSNILEKYYDGVPHWKHQYVYSHSEINGASSEQKDFYIIFKNSFLNGKCFDLEGNTNYAFILLFDLLNDYHEHKNIHILENQLKLLGHSYPKTKSYCNSFLIKKMNLIGYSDGVSRIENSNRYDEYYWKLGRKYKEKLNLNKEDVKLLNDLQYSNNSFNEIEFCMIEIIKLYISVCNHLIQTSTSEEKEKYYYGKRIAISCFYDHIFRYCENTIRESYKYRKLHISYDYFKKAKREFGDKIFSKIAVIMPDLIPQIAQPNEETEIRLFTQNTGRWKHFYKEIKKNYNNNSKQFANEVIKLCALNKLNPKGVEEIFFESTIFVLKHDNEIAIKLYFFYLVNVISNNKILTDKRLIALIAKKDLEEAKKLLKNEHPIVSKLYKFNLYLTEKLFTTDE